MSIRAPEKTLMLKIEGQQKWLFQELIIITELFGYSEQERFSRSYIEPLLKHNKKNNLRSLPEGFCIKKINQPSN